MAVGVHGGVRNPADTPPAFVSLKFEEKMKVQESTPIWLFGHCDFQSLKSCDSAASMKHLRVEREERGERGERGERVDRLEYVLRPNI